MLKHIKEWFMWWFIVPNSVRPSDKTKNKGETYMNIGDKVIAVGAGRKTISLNGSDLHRRGDRTPGFAGLVEEMVVMTIKELDGDTVRTPFYLFHKDDLHLVDTGRASVPFIENEDIEPTVTLTGGAYTREMLEAKLEELA